MRQAVTSKGFAAYREAIQTCFCASSDQSACAWDTCQYRKA